MSDPVDDTNAIPETTKKLLLKYGNLQAAAKQNDSAALAEMIGYLRAREKFNVADAGLLLALLAPTLTLPTARVLVENGATISDTAKFEGRDAIQRALQGKNQDLVVFLVESQLASVNHVEYDGTTLLMAALLTEQYELADKLHALGADLNQQKSMVLGNNETAFHAVSRQGSFQGVLWLMEKGADASIESTNRKIACEVLPQLDEQSKGEWDMDALFDAMEDYKVASRKGEEFEIPVILRKMAYMESSPMSPEEAQERAMAAMAAHKQEQEAKDLGVLPKTKKIGFF